MSSDLTSLTVLAAFAHPDDEGFGSGGTLAMLAARGARITLVSLTNGDVGEISDPSLATPQTLARVRQEEMRQAALVTGVTDVRFLGYRDSGMAGTEDNNHPNSLYQAPPDQVVDPLVAIIREVRPEMIITHDPTGAYGHPDHVTTYSHVTQAFALSGDGAAHPSPPGSGDQPWTPRLLPPVPQTGFANPHTGYLTFGSREQSVSKYLLRELRTLYCGSRAGEADFRFLQP